MISDANLESFFKGFSQHERQYVETWSEYQNAIKRGEINTAIEVASIILLNNLGYRETKAILRKHFPDL
ncbi:hypothetical protein SBV1_200012 [Verrucomicrobia bacterium]|nr:hypothetical protein SBV1_200012 [Verrucomicrobiota bacterium]